MELECTWGLSTSESSKGAIKDKRKAETLTPFEEYLDKRKEKRKAKRMCKLSEKSNKNDQTSESEDYIPSDVDMNDPYFTDELKPRASKTNTAGRNSNKKLKTSNDLEEKEDAELELVLMDKNEYESKNHFNMKKIEENESLTKSKKKRLKRKNKDFIETQTDDFEINVHDPRFEALFTSHNFNIDPADPHYRKTKATESLVNEKLNRRNMLVNSVSTYNPIIKHFLPLGYFRINKSTRYYNNIVLPLRVCDTLP